MISFTDILAVIGLFAVRVGIPIAVTALLVYLLKRLDRRWEHEARAQQGQQPPALRPTTRPSSQRDRPGIQMPFDPSRPLPAGLTAAARRPCWEIKGCLKAQYQQCAAYQNPDLLCWQARLKADGKIPEACPSCEIFQHYPMM